MSNTRLVLWIEPSENQLYADWQVNNFAEAPVFKQGDDVEVELHLVRRLASQFGIMEEIPFPAGCNIRLAIGQQDKSPTAGTFTVAYDGEVATLNYNSTALEVQTALNSLSTITAAGGVVVSKVNTVTYKVDFNTAGENEALLVNTSALVPPSANKLVTLRAGSLSLSGSYLIKVYRSPCVWQDTWTDLDTPQAVITELTPNRVKRVTISPRPKGGSWLLTSTANITPKVLDAGDEDDLATYWSESITHSFSPTAKDSSFLYGQDESVSSNAIGKSRYQATASLVDAYTWDFQLRDDYDIPVGYAFPFTVDDGGLIGFNGKTASLNLNTVEIDYLLNGASSTTAVIEIELDVGGKKWTVLQRTCTIINDLIDQETFSPISYQNAVQEAPIDGKQYVRRDGNWYELEIDGGTF